METSTIIQVTDEAITKILEKQTKERFEAIRLGITGGGCAGFEYIFDSCNDIIDDTLIRLDYGKFAVIIDKISIPYLVGMTLDYQKEGLNEVFKFINPKETSSCGCGISINFDLEKVNEDKIFAIEV